jgi:hypothetical protein
MPLTKLQFKPGIDKEGTNYSNEGGWFDCDKVRFRQGLPEKIGGWERKSNLEFLGTCRAIHPFIALNGNILNGVGTHLKYYIEQGGGYNDITPLRLTTTAGDVTFAASSGSSIITVADNDHGAVEGDFVTFSGADSLGGNITDTILNDEYQIVSVIGANSYTIDVGVNADGSDSGDGGSLVVGAYQINVGLDTTVGGPGWGSGSWSRGSWGSASTSLVTSDILRLWTHDNFGEDLIFNVYDGGIYYWDTSADTLGVDRGVTLASLSDAFCPTIAKKVIISDRDRHVITFGSDPLDNIGTQDPLLIRWSDQENPFVWFPTNENTAGDLRIGGGSRIVTAVETRQQILVFTETTVHSMQYLGPPFTFGIDQLATGTSIASPNAVTTDGDVCYWMGDNDFFVFNGRVQKMPCSVKSYVFDDFNLAQKEKVFAGNLSQQDEVWWFYCSAQSEEIDRYVIFNNAQNIWYIGTLVRTAWIDEGVNSFALAAGVDGYLYNQEAGLDDGSQVPALPIDAYIESSPLELGEGYQFSFIRRLIPDITFTGSNVASPTVDMTIKAQDFPGGGFEGEDDSNVIRTATSPVERFTEQNYIRIRGRSFSLRVDSDTLGTKWRLGTPRIEIRQDGRR